jgi:ABC-2 type transport system ATP-binding protein
MIAASGLTRRYGGREAVRDVTFSVAPGEVVGFLGPNGAGKSTTMRLLLGLLRPHGGTASIGAAVGYLPEQFAAYDALSVRSYLRFMARMKAVDGDDLASVLDAAGVADLADRPVARLSKGQRQRVGMAQALLGRPGAYVLDEPTQGLDPSQVVDTRRLIRSLATEQGAAVLLSTHLLAEVAAMCDRVVVIVRGRIVADEPIGDKDALEARFLRLVGESELTS